MASRISDHIDVTELLGAAGSGDNAAWSEIIRRYAGLVRAVCQRYGLTPERSDDVAQVTWLQLWTHAHQIRDPRALGGWLATTAARESLAMQRRRRREVPMPDCGIDSPVVDDVDARIDAENHNLALRRAVATLNRRERALIEVLLEPEQPSYSEISRRLSMPIGAIGPVRQRALCRLRERLTMSADDVWADRSA
jgi:RNA polymerase sigma factor (sigma-70 family)